MKRTLWMHGLLLLGLIGTQAADTIYVVQRDWHTGIVLKTKDLDPEIWPERVRYESYQNIDISWGDEYYYQSQGHSVLLAARAVLFPTSGVIRIIGVHQRIPVFYANYTVLPLKADSGQMEKLTRFITESFKRNKQGDVIPSTAYNPSNLFFLSRRKYHLFRTCNTWVALALKESGFDISTFMLLTKGQLLRRVEKLTFSAGYE